jgi:hypothetical protein
VQNRRGPFPLETQREKRVGVRLCMFQVLGSDFT